VTLAWAQPRYNGGQALSSFKVYRQLCAQEEIGFVLIQTLPASQFEFTDTSVTGGEEYSFYVTASNQRGGESLPSQSFKVVPITVPSGMNAPFEVTHD
jgi:hypothetical protein